MTLTAVYEKKSRHTFIAAQFIGKLNVNTKPGLAKCPNIKYQESYCLKEL